MPDYNVTVAVNLHEGIIAIGAENLNRPARKWELVLLVKVLEKIVTEVLGSCDTLYALETNERNYCVCCKVNRPEPTSLPLKQCAHNVKLNLQKTLKFNGLVTLVVQAPVLH